MWKTIRAQLIEQLKSSNLCLNGRVTITRKRKFCWPQSFKHEVAYFATSEHTVWCYHSCAFFFISTRHLSEFKTCQARDQHRQHHHGRNRKNTACRTRRQNFGREGRKVCVLTRGYGRKNPNERVLVSDGLKVFSNPAEAGDEPYLLASNLVGVAAV